MKVQINTIGRDHDLMIEVGLDLEVINGAKMVLILQVNV